MSEKLYHEIWGVGGLWAVWVSESGLFGIGFSGLGMKGGVTQKTNNRPHPLVEVDAIGGGDVKLANGSIVATMIR